MFAALNCVTAATATGSDRPDGAERLNPGQPLRGRPDSISAGKAMYSATWRPGDLSHEISASDQRFAVQCRSTTGVPRPIPSSCAALPSRTATSMKPVDPTSASGCPTPTSE